MKPIGVSLFPHFLCSGRIFSRSYYLRSLFIAVVLIGANIPGPSQLTFHSLYLLSQLLEEIGQASSCSESVTSLHVTHRIFLAHTNLAESNLEAQGLFEH